MDRPKSRVPKEIKLPEEAITVCGMRDLKKDEVCGPNASEPL